MPYICAERLLGHDLGDRADAEPALDDERDALDVVGDLVERVAHHEHREVVALVQLAHEAEDLRRGDEVHAVRRLVEHEDVRLADQRAGDQRALLLPAGEGAERLVGEVADADVLERRRAASSRSAGVGRRPRPMRS